MKACILNKVIQILKVFIVALKLKIFNGKKMKYGQRIWRTDGNRDQSEGRRDCADQLWFSFWPKPSTSPSPNTHTHTHHIKPLETSIPDTRVQAVSTTYLLLQPLPKFSVIRSYGVLSQLHRHIPTSSPDPHSWVLLKWCSGTCTSLACIISGTKSWKLRLLVLSPGLCRWQNDI